MIYLRSRFCYAFGISIVYIICFMTRDSILINIFPETKLNCFVQSSQSLKVLIKIQPSDQVMVIIDSLTTKIIYLNRQVLIVFWYYLYCVNNLLQKVFYLINIFPKTKFVFIKSELIFQRRTIPERTSFEPRTHPEPRFASRTFKFGRFSPKK